MCATVGGSHALHAAPYAALYSGGRGWKVVLYVPEILDMRRVLLCMLEAVEGELCLLEELEVMRCVLFCILEALMSPVCWSCWRRRRCCR